MRVIIGLGGDATTMMMTARISEAGFKEGRPVISDIDFLLEEGELLLIVGASGSGKTTLILSLTGVLNNLLNGYVKGEVNLFGVNPLTPEGFIEIPRIVGVVLQDPDKQIAMPTPIDEVAFTLENLGYTDKAVEELALKSLEWMKLKHKAYSSTEELSGGEKKRLCTAASIIHKPRLLIFDEPTANLDPWGISEIVNYIKEFKGKHTIIVIEHKARYFLNLADKLLLIDKGKQVLYVAKDYIEKNHTQILSLLEEYGVDATTPKTKKYTLESTGERETTVSIRNLWFKYPTGKNYTLKNINLTLREGDIAVIVGPNGSGKTTLLKIIAGFYKPSKGEVEVSSTQPYRLKGKSRAKTVFYVPQEPDYLFIYDTVLKELESIGLREEEITRITESTEWFRRVLDLSPYKLSHGQRRWLAYTIAKLYNPKVILFDEPTAGLDIKLLKEYIKWVNSVREENKTIVIATHDVRLVCEIASRTFIMDNGVLREVPIEEAIRFLEEPVWGAGDE